MITDPELPLTPLKHWFHKQWQVEATCQCGRVMTVHRGQLLRILGDEWRYSADRLAQLRPRLKCIRCGRREPRLEVVRKEA